MSAAVIMTAPEFRRAQRKAIFATALLAVAVGAWLHLLTPAIAEKPQAIPRALFAVGDHVCRKNDGLVSVEAYPNRPETFGIRCGDGAMFPDVTARVR